MKVIVNQSLWNSPNQYHYLFVGCKIAFHGQQDVSWAFLRLLLAHWHAFIDGVNEMVILWASYVSLGRSH